MFKKPKPLRLFYAAGPGNVLGTYRYWIDDQHDPSQVSVTYSGQFYEVCRVLDAEGYIFSSHPQRSFYRDERFVIEHCPKLLVGRSGVLYHIGQVLHGIRLIIAALFWRANVVIVADETTYWFVLSILPYLGIKVIPSIHCVLWRKYLRQRRTDKWLLRLSQRLFTKSAYILSASHDITEQINQIVGVHPVAPIVEFLPLYQREEFNTVLAPQPDKRPFRVLFAGRIEEDKGVFDLLEVAKGLAAEGRDDIQFHVCGSGTVLSALKATALQAGLGSSVIFHGYCNKTQMREQLSQAHVLVVPTKSTFVEGFNQVVAEGILAGRPVVTSAVCPALQYVRSGVVEVAPDDIEGYRNAIIRLCDDSIFYEEKRQGCLKIQEQFYDPASSWGGALERGLNRIFKRTSVGLIETDSSIPKSVSDKPQLKLP